MIFTDEEREEILQAFDRWADDNYLTLAARRKAVDAWLAAYDLGVSRVCSKAAVTPEQFEQAAPVDWREAQRTEQEQTK